MLAVSRTFTKEPSTETNSPLRNDHAWIFSRTRRQTIHDLNNWFTVSRLSSFLIFFYANYSNNDNDANYCIETVFKTCCRLLLFWVFRNERQKKLQWKLMMNKSIKRQPGDNKKVEYCTIFSLSFVVFERKILWTA